MTKPFGLTLPALPKDIFDELVREQAARGETMEPTPEDALLRAGASVPTETGKAFAADPLEEAMQGMKRWDETLEHTLQLQRETFGDPPDDEDTIKDYRDIRG